MTFEPHATSREKEFDMPVILEERDALSVICLDGVIDISDAEELKRLLLQALKLKDGVRVSLQGAADLDITAMQLLWAAERETVKLGAPFTLAGVVPKEISAAISSAGFDNFPTNQKIVSKSVR
jgi:anti-anti-sigma regulatory factor